MQYKFLLFLLFCGLLSIDSLAQVPMSKSSVKKDEQPQYNGLNNKNVIDTGFHLFLLAGQSNMAGRGFLDDTSQITDERILMLDKDNHWVPAVDPVHFDKKGAGVGPGISFARELLKHRPHIKVGLIPSAVGGSSIISWQPDSVYIGVHPYNDAVRRMKLALRYGVLDAILWHQGESDDSPKAAQNYLNALIQLIARFRKEAQNSDLPFIAGELGHFHPRYINDELAKLSGIDKATAVVSAAGLTSNPDHIHFNTSSARMLGRRYAETYIHLTDKTK